MCALLRDRMPEDENASLAGTISRRTQAAMELQRAAMGQLIDGLPTGRIWFLR